MRELSDIEHELKLRPQDPRFDPPYATLQVTRIDGGTATNIVPVSCRMDFDVRAIPGVDIAAIDRRIHAFAANVCLPEMRKVAPEAPIDIAIANQVPPFSAGSSSEVVALALNLAGQNETHAVSYATEAGLFQVAGSPAVVIGPGDIAQAHTADEWIAKDQIDKCSAFLARLGDWAEHARPFAERATSHLLHRAAPCCRELSASAPTYVHIGLSRQKWRLAVNRPALRATTFSVLSLLASLAPVAAAQEESDAGQVAYNNACRTCHSFKPGDNRLGPTLHGVVGRKAGSRRGLCVLAGHEEFGSHSGTKRHSTSSSAIPARSSTATKCSLTVASLTLRNATRSSTI